MKILHLGATLLTNVVLRAVCELMYHYVGIM